MELDELSKIITKLRDLGQEWDTVDAKRELDLQQDGSKAEFIKDIVAMANNAVPSQIIVGLQDGTFQDVGHLGRHYELNDINQILKGRIDPPVSVGYREFVIGLVEYALIEINGQNPPYIVATDIIHQSADRQRSRVYKGSIYVRAADGTVGVSRAGLEQLMRRTGLRKLLENESDRSIEIAINKPGNWEYILTVELLRSHFAALRHQMNDVKRGLVYRRARKLNGMEYINWVQERLQDLVAILAISQICVTEEFNVAWGIPGQAGDPILIKRVVDKLTESGTALIEWELEFRNTMSPDKLKNLHDMMAGWTQETMDAIFALPDQIETAVRQAMESGQPAQITVVFQGPPNVAQALQEIEVIKQNPLSYLT